MIMNLSMNFELLARGRGIGRLIAGAMEGDPVALTILGVLVVGFIAYVGYSMWASDD